MVEKGLTDNEIDKYFEFNDRCNFESMTRKWRKEHPDETNKEREQEFREEYTPSEPKKIMRAYEIAAKQRTKNDPPSQDNLFQ